MKRFAAPIVAFACSLIIVLGASAQQNNIPPPNPSCAPDGGVHLNGQMYPTSIEPEFSIWCYTQPSPIPATAVSGANDWVDTFDNAAPSILQFNDHDMGYRVFDALIGPASSFKTGYFVNVNHWMIDLVDTSTDRLSGGVMVSPDKQFHFENGKLVVEVDAAAGSDGMGGANRFYEIDLSPAPAITGTTTDALYGYGQFGHVGAMGCRLERNDQGGNFVCAMYDNTGRVTGGECPPQNAPCTGPDGLPGRVWETQGPGTSRTAASITGNTPQSLIPGTNLLGRQVWRQCADNELDLHCRDRFRMEVTKDSIHLFVNGYPYMQIDGLFAQNPATGADNRIPDFWFQQGVRPYFTSWINGGQHSPTRWHWDRIAVNPHNPDGSFAAPSAAPSFCLGQPNNTCPDPAGGPTSQQLTMLDQPQRVVDTRVAGGRLAAGETRCFTLAGAAGVPSNAAGVVLNATATGYTDLGWLTLFPAGQAMPNTSTVNFDTGVYAIANNAVVPLGAGGQVCVNAGRSPTQVILDVTGYVAAGSAQLQLLMQPQRVLDTRSSGGRLQAGETRCVTLAGVAGVPASASGVLLNVTDTGSTDVGWLTLFPAGQVQPTTSTLNFDPRAYAVANAAVVRLGSGGQVCVNDSRTASNVILDVTGYVAAGSGQVQLLGQPQRLVDTRQSGGRFAAGETRCYVLAGQGGIPSSASGVVLNITATGYTDFGWLTLFPAGQAMPATSSLNFDTGAYAVANGAMIRAGNSGGVCVTAGRSPTHVVLDATGYF